MYSITISVGARVAAGRSLSDMFSLHAAVLQSFVQNDLACSLPVYLGQFAPIRMSFQGVLEVVTALRVEDILAFLINSIGAGEIFELDVYLLPDASADGVSVLGVSEPLQRFE